MTGKTAKILLFTILLALKSCQETETEGEKKTKINDLFSITAPMSETTIMNWITKGPTKVEKDKLIFHGGEPGKKSIMLNYSILDYDDYIQLDLTAKFNKKISNIENVKNDDKMNGFFIEFLPTYGKEIFNKEIDNETISLQGFVILLMTHNDEATNRTTHFITYRFFSKSVVLKRDYFNILFEKREKYDFCEYPSLGSKTDFRIKIDYENKNELILEHKEKSESEWNTCFKVEQIEKYITKSNIFLQFQQTTGKKYTMSTEIYNLEIREKEHRLDVDKSLVVSHHLMEEIFDKVKNFSEIFENDKDSLTDIVEMQNNLLRKSTMLEVYARDLNLGSKKFQEYMIESLNRHKFVSPQSYPKLIKIKEKIESLEKKQQKIYERFINIKGLLESKKIFKKTYSNFKKIDKLLTKIVREISSKEFKDFTSKTRKLMRVLKKIDFKDFLKNVSSTLKSQHRVASSTANYGMMFVGCVCIVVLIFAYFIFKNISQAEKSHFA